MIIQLFVAKLSILVVLGISASLATLYKQKSTRISPYRSIYGPWTLCSTIAPRHKYKLLTTEQNSKPVPKS